MTSFFAKSDIRRFSSDWAFFLQFDSGKNLIRIFGCKVKRVRQSYTALFQNVRTFSVATGKIVAVNQRKFKRFLFSKKMEDNDIESKKKLGFVNMLIIGFTLFYKISPIKTLETILNQSSLPYSQCIIDLSN